MKGKCILYVYGILKLEIIVTIIIHDIIWINNNSDKSAVRFKIGMYFILKC